MKTILNVKTDLDIKEEAQKLAGTLGLSLSTVVNAYLRQFIRDKEVSFSLAPQMTPELEKILGGIERDIQQNKNLSQSFSSSQALKRFFAKL